MLKSDPGGALFVRCPSCRTDIAVVSSAHARSIARDGCGICDGPDETMRSATRPEDQPLGCLDPLVLADLDEQYAALRHRRPDAGPFP